MDSLTYCQELAHHGYGFALYYPEHSGCLVPGAVGYFNEDGVFIRVSSVPSLSPRKCFITTHFGPKCSRRTEVNEVEAGLRGSIPISPFPITVDIAYLYRSLVEKGAILITRGQITQKNIDIDNDHAFDWIDANQADIVGSNPAAFERDLWLVTQTITAKGASTKAWKDGQKRHCIGFKIGARDFQVTLPSWDHYVMRMGGTDLQGWNDHNINTPPTFPTDWVISFFLCLGLASALLGHRIVFLSLALLAWCLNRKFVLSNEEMVIFMNGYLFRLENKNKKLKNTRFRREYALKTVLGTFWRRGTYMGAQPPLSHSSRRDFEALNRTIRGETRGGDWSATRGGIKVRLPLQVKEPTGFDHAESDFLLYPSRRRLRDIERIKKFEDSLGLCDGIDKLEMSISAPLNVPNYLKPTQVDESGDQNGSFDIYGQSKESRARRLLIAAGTGNLDTVNHLLRDIDANVCAETFGQRTALQVASNNGSPETVKSLLDANADPNCEVSEWDGRSPLRAASENGHLKVAKELVIKEAKVNTPPTLWDGRTAL